MFSDLKTSERSGDAPTDAGAAAAGSAGQRPAAPRLLCGVPSAAEQAGACHCSCCSCSCRCCRDALPAPKPVLLRGCLRYSAPREYASPCSPSRSARLATGDSAALPAALPAAASCCSSSSAASSCRPRLPLPGCPLPALLWPPSLCGDQLKSAAPLAPQPSAAKPSSSLCASAAACMRSAATCMATSSAAATPAAHRGLPLLLPPDGRCGGVAAPASPTVCW